MHEIMIVLLKLAFRFGEAAPAAIFDAFSFIINDVLSDGKQRKAVINFSSGTFPLVPD